MLRNLCTKGHPNMVALIAEGRGAQRGGGLPAGTSGRGGTQQQAPQSYHLVLEHCPASLVDVLRDFPDGLPRPQLMALLHDCVEALMLMHGSCPPIAHRYDECPSAYVCPGLGGGAASSPASRGLAERFEGIRDPAGDARRLPGVYPHSSSCIPTLLLVLWTVPKYWRGGGAAFSPGSRGHADTREFVALWSVLVTFHRLESVNPHAQPLPQSGGVPPRPAVRQLHFTYLTRAG